MATPHTEEARSILSALKAISLPEDKRDLIVRGVNALDQELHEFHTGAAATLTDASADIADIGWTLPSAYSPLEYTPKQRRMVAMLLKANGRGLSREYMYEAITGRDVTSLPDRRTPQIKMIDVMAVHCRRVLASSRSDLNEAGLPSYLNTVWGIGYSLNHEARTDASMATRIALAGREYKVSPQGVRVLDFMKAAKGRFVTESEIARVAQFKPDGKTPRHMLIDELFRRLRKYKGIKTERNAKHDYRLVNNG